MIAAAATLTRNNAKSICLFCAQIYKLEEDSHNF